MNVINTTDDILF